MSLLRRGDELVIRVDDRELMGSRVHGSEDALADLACDRLRDCTAARVLVGGLGMGFTLAAALRRVGSAGQVVVAELVPVVVDWNRGVVGAVAGHPLEDPRVGVHEGDVGALIRKSGQAWDVVLLDVDNGPTALTRADNAGLYGRQGLDALHAALRPGGVAAVWSAAPDVSFTRRFEQAGFEVDVVEVRARGKKGGRRHTIWLGKRRDDRPR